MIKLISNNSNIHRLGLKGNKEKKTYKTSPIKSDSFSNISFKGSCEFCNSITINNANLEKFINKFLDLKGDELAKLSQRFSDGFSERVMRNGTGRTKHLKFVDKSKLRKEKQVRFKNEYNFWGQIPKHAKNEPDKTLEELIKLNFDLGDKTPFEYIEKNLNPFVKSKDHLIPDSIGGMLFEENTGHICIACNTIKGNRLLKNIDRVYPEIRRNLGDDRFDKLAKVETKAQVRKFNEEMAQKPGRTKQAVKHEPTEAELIDKRTVLIKESEKLDGELKLAENELESIKKIEGIHHRNLKNLYKHPYLKAYNQKRKLKKRINELGLLITEHTTHNYIEQLEKHLKNKPKAPVYDEAKYNSYVDKKAHLEAKKLELQENLKNLDLRGLPRKLKNKKIKDAQEKLSAQEAKILKLNKEEKPIDFEIVEEYKKEIKNWIDDKSYLEGKVEITKKLPQMKTEQYQKRQELTNKAEKYPSKKRISKKVEFIDKLLESNKNIPAKLQVLETQFKKEASNEGIKATLSSLEEKLAKAKTIKQITIQIETEDKVNSLKNKQRVINNKFKKELKFIESKMLQLGDALANVDEKKDIIPLQEKGIEYKTEKLFRQIIKQNSYLDIQIGKLNKKVSSQRGNLKIINDEFENLKKSKLSQENSYIIAGKVTSLEAKINKIKQNIISTQKEIQLNESLKKTIPAEIEEKLTKEEIIQFQKVVVKNTEIDNNIELIESELQQYRSEYDQLEKEYSNKLEPIKNEIKKTLKQLGELELVIPSDIKSQIDFEKIKEKIKLSKRRAVLNKQLNGINTKIDELKKENKNTSVLEERQESVNGKLKEIAPLFNKEDRVKKLNKIISGLQKQRSGAKTQEYIDILEVRFTQVYKELDKVKEQMSNEVIIVSEEKLEKEISYFKSLLAKDAKEVAYNTNLTKRIDNLKQEQIRMHKLDEPLGEDFLSEDGAMKVLIQKLGINSLVKKLGINFKDIETKEVKKKILNELGIKTYRDYLTLRKAALQSRKDKIIALDDEIDKVEKDLKSVREEKSPILGKISSLKHQKGNKEAKIYQINKKLEEKENKKNVTKTQPLEINA